MLCPFSVQLKTKKGKKQSSKNINSGVPPHLLLRHGRLRLVGSPLSHVGPGCRVQVVLRGHCQLRTILPRHWMDRPGSSGLSFLNMRRSSH